MRRGERDHGIAGRTSLLGVDAQALAAERQRALSAFGRAIEGNAAIESKFVATGRCPGAIGACCPWLCLLNRKQEARLFDGDGAQVRVSAQQGAGDAEGLLAVVVKRDQFEIDKELVRAWWPGEHFRFVSTV